MDCDTIFLILLTGVSLMILAIDVKVLEKMFQEMFRVQEYLDDRTYH